MYLLHAIVRIPIVTPQWHGLEWFLERAQEVTNTCHASFVREPVEHHTFVSPIIWWQPGWTLTTYFWVEFFGIETKYT